MRILAYIMISTNRIFESSHGPEIPNFVEIVAGPYSMGLPRRLRRTGFYFKFFPGFPGLSVSAA
jgi:hypothetical protein